MFCIKPVKVQTRSILKSAFVWSIIIIVQQLKAQETGNISFLNTDTNHVVCYYDRDLLDTVCVPKIDFDSHGKFLYPKQGTIIEIHKNNIMITTTETISDSVITKFYFPSGKIQGIEITSNQTDALLYKEYRYPNGQLRHKISFATDSIQPYQEYWENGNLKTNASWLDAALFGSFTSYYKNGQVESKGQYKDVPVNQKNHWSEESSKEGKWFYYDEKGNLIRTEKYFENKLVE
jgi:antitoxin component YwqK of YwqJK toxin-antitoxin module